MRILIVIVRYKVPLEESETVRTLSLSFHNDPELLKSFGIFVWDNSPVATNGIVQSFPFEYRHTGENLGVSGAYNRALTFAKANGYSWLLLLDQDTSIPEGFLSRLIEHSQAQDDHPQICAIAPFLIDGTVPSSPTAVLLGRNKVIEPPFTGIYPGALFAANSATLMRVSSLAEVGGYDENFWLDLSDVVTFHRLYAAGRRVFIAGDLILQHRITNNDFDGSMSPQRYTNFIAAEGAYWDLYRAVLPRAIYMARLFGRTLRQRRRYRNKVFSSITLRYFWRRILTSKTTRLREWKERSQMRDIPAISEGRIIA